MYSLIPRPYYYYYYTVTELAISAIHACRTRQRVMMALQWIVQQGTQSKNFRLSMSTLLGSRKELALSRTAC